MTDITTVPEEDRAAPCSGLWGLFYPESLHGGDPWAGARAVCSGCPDRQPCLEGALDRDERFGMWGGSTPEERSVMLGRRSLRRSRVDDEGWWVAEPGLWEGGWTEDGRYLL